MKKIFLLLILTAALTGCSLSSSKGYDTAVEGDTLTTHAGLLTMVDAGEGVVIADITNPWDTTRLLQRLVLVSRDSEADVTALGGTMVKCPVERSMVGSVMFAHAIDELGATGSIAAVSDGEYYKTPGVREAIDNGKIIDTGSSLQPNAELITACRPDLILANPYQNAGHGVLETLRIPIVEMADYMEPTPLGRAEWIKLLGVMYGNYEAADSIFTATLNNYETWKNRRSNARPRVITEMSQDGVWFVPGGESYMARIIADAGADYPWSDNDNAGSLQLDFATVYNTAHDADFWFIKTDNPQFSYKSLKEIYPLNERFRPFREKKVYFLDTTSSMFFEEMAFHPDLLLRDFVIILHPDSSGGELPRYYQPLK